jgi:hypothetical protein
MKKRTKFIPDEKFWVDNGKEFPEVKISSKSGRISWENYNSVEDFQKFIDYFGYWDSNELNNELGSLYQRMIRLRISKKIRYLTTNAKNDLTQLNSLDDFQNFIDAHSDITSSSIFIKQYSGVWNRAKRVLGDLHKKLVFPKSKLQWTHIKTKEDAVKIIKDLGISYRGECYTDYGGLANRLKQLNLLDDVLPLLPHRDYSNIKTLDDANKFIIENNILNQTDMCARFSGLRSAVERLGYSTKELDFLAPRKSRLEIKTRDFLKSIGVNFKSEKTFRETGGLRFDFWLPGYNLILEPGGEQHFIPVEWFGGESYLKLAKERDQTKREFCKKHGITLLYWFSFRKQFQDKIYNILNTAGYPGEYYLDFDEFCNRILEIVGQKEIKEG